MARTGAQQMRFTEKAIALLPIREKKYRINDKQQPGLCVTVRTNGRKVFTVRYVNAQGGSGEATLGDTNTITLTMAREQAQRVRLEAAQGIDPVKAKREQRQAAQTQRVRTVGALIELYLADMEKRGDKRASTQAKERTHLEANLLPRLGHMPISDLKRTTIREALYDIRDSAAKRSGKSGTSAANDCRKYLSQVLAHGVELEWLETNPVRDIKKFKETPRGRVATEGELVALWQRWEGRKLDGKASSWAAAAALQFALLTLQRGEEVVSMEWQEVDFERALWTIPQHRKKEGREAAVPLSRLALSVLQEALDRGVPEGAQALAEAARERTLTPEEKSALSDARREALASGGPFNGRFGDALKRGSFTQAFQRDCEALHIADLTPHDLRRTGRTTITDPERLGFPLHVGEAVISHSVGSKLQQTYDKNSYISEKRAALEAWAAQLGERIG